MTVDLAKHLTPDWYRPFIAEHYDLGIRDRKPGCWCRHCGVDTWHLTKHARNAHGIDVEVLPIAPGYASKGWQSDELGLLVHPG